MIRKVMIVGLLFLLSLGLVTGQTDCPLLVERALQAVDDNCAEMGRNTACYAYNQVQATFLQDVDDNFFTQPSDRANLTLLDTIQTTALDEENNLWGIAMMRVQANVPDTLPGQAVVFMLMGDVQVENAVAPDEAFEPADPIAITTLVASANIRLTPSESGFVLGTVPIDTVFEADGLSIDGEWVRIIFDGQPAWVFRSIVSADSSLDVLPTISSFNRTPMQAFYFSTGAGASTCNEAPDSLMIQGPNSLEVQINANGVDINIGSTIVLESPAPNEINITAVNGYAQVGNVRVPGGFTVDAQTDENGTILPETIAGLRPMDDEKIERFKTLEKIENDSIVNYRVQVPTRQEIVAVEVALEIGQQREAIKAQCRESGLTAEQCASIVGSDTDKNTIRERCINNGFTQDQCRRASGSVDEDGTDIAGDTSSGTVQDRCLSAGYESVEACRGEFGTEPDSRIDLCLALGYNNQSSCRDAYPEDNVDKIVSCVSRGFSTKAECDAADAGVTPEPTTDEDETPSSNLPSQCVERGITSEDQCRTYRRYTQCRNQGRGDAECREYARS